jgi:AcrR family transcriptional regulator
MRKRAALGTEVRRRIVDAAVQVHREKGALQAKPAEIAARANVSLTTYYKHFPTLGTLVTACTARGRELIPPPDPQTIDALPPEPGRRIPAMVRVLFDYYEAREPWIYAGRTEERFIPEVRPVMERLRSLREAFVRTTLIGTAAEAGGVAAANVVVDYWAWRTLRREYGFAQEDAIAATVRALRRLTAGDGATPDTG